MKPDRLKYRVAQKDRQDGRAGEGLVKRSEYSPTNFWARGLPKTHVMSEENKEGRGGAASAPPSPRANLWRFTHEQEN